MSRTSMPAASSSRERSDSPSWRALAAGLPARLALHWRPKAALAVTIAVPYCAGYLIIGNHPLFGVHRLPLTRLDRAIGFHPYAWVWIYQSLYLLVLLIPWMAERRADLWRYAKGFVLMALISFVIFIFYPVAMPRPAMDHPSGMYRLLLFYDARLNSLPSLHAGLAIYTLVFGWRIMRGKIPRGLAAICVAWTALILYGTVATKEHYVIDVIAGTLLALLADRWAWRGKGAEAFTIERHLPPDAVGILAPPNPAPVPLKP